MILSVSRRTDVPAFYFDWFVRRLREGWLLVRNPYNPTQVSRVTLTPEAIDCIVFWTKNPAPMLDRLPVLAPYPFYLQYTINAYDRDMESHLPDISQRVDLFRKLADKLGPERVVWRYSPVVLNQRYSAAWHLEAFERLAGALAGHTEQCKLSFLELYAKIGPRMKSLGVTEPGDAATLNLARQLDGLARSHAISLSACGKPDLRPAGIAVSCCVDGELIRRITGTTRKFRKDPGQRGVCHCVESVDVGSYQTCLNGCAYCYANHSHAAAQRRAERYDPDSPLLCDCPGPGDQVRERAARPRASQKPAQLTLKP